MNSQRLFLAAGLALAFLIAYNVLIHHASHSSQRQRTRAAIDKIPAVTEVVFSGNSLVEVGCDAGTFAAVWSRNGDARPAVNLALGSTSPVEHYLLLEHALRRMIQPKYLIYGFFDDQLNAPVTGEWSSLVGNRALSYYFPNQAADFYAPGSVLKVWELKLTQQLPMLAERSSLWTQVELARRKMAQVGMSERKTNRFGRVDDFATLQAQEVSSFNRRCAAVIDGRRGFSRPVREIARLARARGVKLIFVEMPLPSKHRNTFYASPVWPRMREYLQELAAGEGALYMAASDWVGDDDKFIDDLHLSEEGARFFSAKLGAAVARYDATSVVFAHGR